MFSRDKWARRFAHFRYYSRQHAIEVAVGSLLLLFLIIVFAQNMFYTIPPGSVGVLWERFTGGTVTNRYLGEGFQVIMPWNKIYIYNTRVQIRDENLDVLSVDGLNLQIDVAYQYELVPQNVPTLHEFVGPDYAKVMIDPDVAARSRDIFAKNTPEEIYADRRTDIQKQILDAVNDHLRVAFNPDPKHPVQFVRMEDVLVRSIKLPPSVEQAINSKNEQQQMNQEYDYRILREEKESARKRIEAQGIEQFQNIVSRGITQGYLEWQGIQATLQLAESPNAKVVVIGAGKNGLPLILGDSSGAVSNNTTPRSVSQAPAPVPAATEMPASQLVALLQKLGLIPKSVAQVAPQPSATPRGPNANAAAPAAVPGPAAPIPGAPGIASSAGTAAPAR